MKKITVLYGNEPYCIDFCKQKIIDGISEPEVNILYSDSFDEPELEFLNTVSFFGKKLVVVSINEFKESYFPMLSHYVKQSSSNGEILIITKQINMNLKYVKDFSSCDFVSIKKCDKVSSENDLDKILLTEIKKMGISITQDAFTEFKRRMNYFTCDSINLCNMKNALQDLREVSSEINTDLVKKIVPVNSQDNIYSLAKLLLTKKHAAVRKQINLICAADKAMASMGMLLKEFRIAWKLHYFTLSEIGVKYSVFKGLKEDILFSCMKIIQEGMDSVKSGAMCSDLALKISVAKISAALEPALET